MLSNTENVLFRLLVSNYHASAYPLIKHLAAAIPIVHRNRYIYYCQIIDDRNMKSLLLPQYTVPLVHYITLDMEQDRFNCNSFRIHVASHLNVKI